MSFALEYRRKLQQQEREARRVRKANEGFVSMPAETTTDTTRNRRRVFLALVIAGSVLGVFNSGALVRYTQDLANTPVGPRLIVMSETWHEMMRKQQVTHVVDQIRDTVALARESSWGDLTFGLRHAAEEDAPVIGAQPKIVPAKGDPAPERREDDTPPITKPAGPVLRASADRVR